MENKQSKYPYIKRTILDRGFESKYDYHQYTAKKKGFSSYEEYLDSKAKEKGYNSNYEAEMEKRKERQERKINTKLSSFLYKNLEEKNLTQREFSRLCDINSASINNYIRGISIPPKENLKKIAKALNIKLKSLENSLK